VRTHDAEVPRVRTTVRIDDELYRRVKERAAREGRTVAGVLEDAVRVGMSAADDIEPAHFVVPTFGSGGLVPGVDLSSNSSLRELLDESTPLERLR
jgi:predicted DNA-binding protein